MIHLEAALKGAETIRAALKKAQDEKAKALSTSIKVEAFRLSKILKDEIRSGAPGGNTFRPLTFLARRKAKSTRPNKPLAKLALPVRYDVTNQSPFTVAIGWTNKVSSSWKQIAERQQEGFESRVTDRRRRFFRHKADDLSARSPNRKFLFLRDQTTELSTPARPIIEPFYKAHQFEAWEKIRSNFRRKMRGEKI